MSRFYFNTSTISGIAASLESVKNNLESNEKKINTVSDILFINEGFNIKNIVDSLQKQGTDIDLIKTQLSDGQNVIREITGLTDSYANAAYTAMDKLSGTTAGAINNVTNIIQDLAKNTGKGSVSDTAPTAETIRKNITFENAQHGDVFTANGYTYEKFSHWGSEKLLRTDAAGGIGLFDKNGNLFETYKQGDQTFYHDEDPGIECTSTALAQSSTINGLYREPHQYNDNYGYTQIKGEPASSEDITRFCVDNLKNGCSTVIYYNYTGHESNHINWGHAVTVVGANANATTVHDLWVIDPATGQYVDFDQAYGAKSNSMFICYESNPGQFGGAGTREEHIQSYFSR